MGLVRKIAIAGAAIAGLLTSQPLVRAALKPSAPPPTAEMRERAKAVTILRDSFGVPHIFADTDANAAFGLAYAHAEDDFPMIQGVLAAARGQLGLVSPSWTSLTNDGYAALVGVEAEVSASFEALDPHTREVFEGYAQGLDYYAALHPDEVDARLLPFEAIDIGRGFAHKLPLMVGVGDVLKALSEGAPLPSSQPSRHAPGSNAHAIAPHRSTDGATRLNINSHQPWEGPVSWYEAQVRSEEGWDMYGGTFPGAPMLLHGFSSDLGWALTVNTPDRVDVYALVTDPSRPGEYRYGGQWLPFEQTRAWLPFETPWLTLQIPRTFLRSKHGPVVESEGRYYAIRHVAMGASVAAAEQWFAMNKAKDLAQWYAAMDKTAIPMFNAVYADRQHIFYLYNARVPQRPQGYDYTGILPGDDPALVWDRFLPLEDLPQVLDPASGFVQGCNSTPYSATLGNEAPIPAMFPPEAGIETRLTARSKRTLDRLADGALLDAQGFADLKWDRQLPADSQMHERLLEPLRSWQPGADEPADVLRARELLLSWDEAFSEDSAGAAIATLAWQPLEPMGHAPLPSYDPIAALREAAAWLRENHGKIEVPLGDIQRLVRGETDLPLGGGPDILNCTYHERKGGKLVGDQGDSLVILAEFLPDGPVRAQAIQQYGASNRPDSPHYSDQAPLFVRRQMRPVLRTLEEIRADLEREYHPGEEIP